jgi:hypothetical protein
MPGVKRVAAQYHCTVAEDIQLGYNHSERCERRRLADSTNGLKNRME